MARICIELNNCMACPFVISERMWTSDSFEEAYDYFCGEKRERATGMPKKIAGYIEWEREMPDVPNWCPHLVK